MDSKDRERLMLSTGIALVGYAIIFLVLMGLNWPEVLAFRAITPPTSLYVSLQGSLVSAEVQKQTAPPQVQSKPTVQAPAAAKTTPAPAQRASVETPSNATSTTQSSSASGPQSAPPAPVASQATAVPSQPNIPTSITSSAGPSGPAAAAGSVPQSGGTGSGPPSATAGVNYPSGSQYTAPPQGGGTGTQPNQGQSQTYYGTAGTSNGNFFNPELAAAAGTGGTSTGGKNSTSTSQAQGSATAGGGSSTSGGGTAGGGGGSGSGSQGSTSGGPQISWTNATAARTVESEPKPLVIPRQFLDEIPPSITLSIRFEVTPAGTVNALQVSPSLGYPQLDIMLEQWMEEWRFVPVTGTQVAQGTLPYVIQATTAR